MIRYRVFPAHRCVLVYMDGSVLTRDILDYSRRLTVDPERRQRMSELIDMRDVDDYLVDAKGIQRIVFNDQDVQDELGISRRAIVCDQDHIFGMLRMYEILGETLDAEIATFRGMDEALVWLDKPQEMLDLLQHLKHRVH